MIPTPDPNRPQPSRTFKVIVWLLTPVVKALTKREWAGAERLPEGGFIAVTNHISDADPFPFVHFLVEQGIYPAILGKQELFRVPVLRHILTALGVIPVHRGTVDAKKSLAEALAALEAGKCVVIYPEGTHTFDPELWPMTAKTGAARLALISGAPVVPIAQWGAHKFRNPHSGKFRFRRFRSQVLAGDPVDLSEFASNPTDSAAVAGATAQITRELTLLLAQLRGEEPPAEPYDRHRGSPRTRYWTKGEEERIWN